MTSRQSSLSLFFDNKDGKTAIQPSSIVTLTEIDFTAAGENMSKIIDAILNPIIKAGQTYDDNEDNIDYAIENMPKVFGVMNDAGAAIATWYEKVGSKPEIWGSQSYFLTLNNGILYPLAAAATNYYAKFRGNIDNLLKVMPDILDKMAAVRDEIKNWSTIDPAKAGDGFNYFVTNIMNAFNKQNTSQFMGRLSDFTKNMSILINGSTKLEKVADSFERIADAFDNMKDSINAMEIERLTQVTKLMGFLDGLANGKSSDIVADMGEAITKGMEALKDILEEIKTQLGTSTASTGASAGGDGLGIGPGTSTAKPPAATAADKTKAPPTPPVDIQPIVAAINSLKSTLTSEGVKIKGKFLGS